MMKQYKTENKITEGNKWATDIDKLIPVQSDIFPQRAIIYDDSRFTVEDPASESKKEYSATKYIIEG